MDHNNGRKNHRFRSRKRKQHQHWDQHCPGSSYTFTSSLNGVNGKEDRGTCIVPSSAPETNTAPAGKSTAVFHKDFPESIRKDWRGKGDSHFNFQVNQTRPSSSSQQPRSFHKGKSCISNSDRCDQTFRYSDSFSRHYYNTEINGTYWPDCRHREHSNRGFHGIVEEQSRYNEWGQSRGDRFFRHGEHDREKFSQHLVRNDQGTVQKEAERAWRKRHVIKKKRGKNKHKSFTSGKAAAMSLERVDEQTKIQGSGQNCSTGAQLDLPGYYYNAEKKCYYKIQPDHQGFDESIITMQTIAKVKAEQQRQKDLSALKVSESSPSSAVKWQRNLRKSLFIPSVSNVLLNGAYQRGEVDKCRLQKASVLNCVSRLHHCNTRSVFSAQLFQENLEHMLQMETSPEHDKLLCLWSVTGTMVERLQLVDIKEGKRTYPGEFTLEFSSSSTVVQSWNKITSMCWSDFSQFPGKKYVLYTTICHSGATQSLAFIRNLDPTPQDQVNFFDFNLGTHTSWACAWNYHKQQFGVGTEKGCLVVDVNTRKLWQFKTKNSNAISQIFTKEDGGNLLYTGVRNGSILKHDLRSSSTLPVTLMNHKAAVCCLRLSHDEQYLYASDFSGKILKWDLRMKKAVLNYDGLMNKYSKLPFFIDETQSVLYAAGQDCYTKLWCLKSARLLQSIPPPYEASVHTIPAVQYSSRWANMEGMSGLVMGAQKSFYLYGDSVGGTEL